VVLVVKDLHKVTSQIYIKQNNKLVLLRCTSWERCKCSTYYDIRAHTVVTFSAQTKKKPVLCQYTNLQKKIVQKIKHNLITYNNQSYRTSDMSISCFTLICASNNQKAHHEKSKTTHDPDHMQNDDN
jgi:hypothetical protein